MSKPLHSTPDVLRNVVEKLLAIFCTDPLTEALFTEEPQNVLSTPASQKRLAVPNSRHSQHSPFDLPSGNGRRALKSAETQQLNTGSPISRKKIEGLSIAT